MCSGGAPRASTSGGSTRSTTRDRVVARRRAPLGPGSTAPPVCCDGSPLGAPRGGPAGSSTPGTLPEFSRTASRKVLPRRLPLGLAPFFQNPPPPPRPATPPPDTSPPAQARVQRSPPLGARRNPCTGRPDCQHHTRGVMGCHRRRGSAFENLRWEVYRVALWQPQGYRKVNLGHPEGTLLFFK